MIPAPTRIHATRVDENFLNEGATVLNDQEIAFVNLYNAHTFDGTELRRKKSSSIYIVNLTSETIEEFVAPHRLCATSVIPTTDENLLLVTTPEGIFTVHRGTKKWELWFAPPFISDWPKGTRPNDCRLDPLGNLFMSWMGEGAQRDAPHSKQGEVWRVSPQRECIKVMEGLYIPNGHAFTPHPTRSGSYRLFFNDTARELAGRDLPKGIDAYIYDPVECSVVRDPEFSQGVFLELKNEGYPDGMALASGNLLIPMFNGGRVDVVDINQRKIVTQICVEGAPQTTSIAVLPSGKALLTTASEFYTKADFEKFPNAGGVFYIDLSSIGIFGERKVTTFSVEQSFF